MTFFRPTDCGDTLIAGAVKALESSCNMGCGGNTTYVPTIAPYSCFLISCTVKHVGAAADYQSTLPLAMLPPFPFPLY